MWLRAGVPAGRAGRRRPARDLEDLEAVRGRPVGDVHERRVRERRGQEAELHRASPDHGARRVGGAPRRSTSTQRPRGRCSAIASPTSISSWPSANVAIRRAGRQAARRRRRRRSARNSAQNVSPKPSTWPPGRRGCRLAGRPISAGLRRRISFGRSRWPSHRWSGCLGVPRPRPAAAVDLVLEGVLPAGADLARWSPRRGRRWRSAAGSTPTSSVGHLAADGVGGRARSRTSRRVPWAACRIVDERRELGHAPRRSAGRS